MKQNKRINLIISIIIFLSFLLPAYIIVSNSFKTNIGIISDPFKLPYDESFSGSNYIKAAERMNLLDSFENSLLVTLISTAFIILLASMASWVLVRFKRKLSTFIYYSYLATLLIPFQYIMLPLLKLLSDINMLNQFGLIICYIGLGLPLSIVVFYNYIKILPKEIEEAAVIDGFGPLRLFCKVIFPNLKPVTIFAAIINIVWIWNDFLISNLIISSDPSRHTLTLNTYYFLKEFSGRWDITIAGVILSALPAIIFYLFVHKRIIQDLTDISVIRI